MQERLVYMVLSVHGTFCTWAILYMGLSVHGPFCTWAFVYMGLSVCFDTVLRQFMDVLTYVCSYHTVIPFYVQMYDCNDILALNLLSISYSSVANASHT